jgi:hypothetical protein
MCRVQRWCSFSCRGAIMQSRSRSRCRHAELMSGHRGSAEGLGLCRCRGEPGAQRCKVQRFRGAEVQRFRGAEY